MIDLHSMDFSLALYCPPEIPTFPGVEDYFTFFQNHSTFEIIYKPCISLYIYISGYNYICVFSLDACLLWQKLIHSFKFTNEGEGSDKKKHARYCAE